jgi:hypothetical protein
MANGDDAAAIGIPIMDGSEDWRDGWDAINAALDQLATRAVIANQETYVHNDVGGNRIVIQRVPATLTLEAWIDNTRLGTINITP